MAEAMKGRSRNSGPISALMGISMPARLGPMSASELGETVSSFRHRLGHAFDELPSVDQLAVADELHNLVDAFLLAQAETETAALRVGAAATTEEVNSPATGEPSMSRSDTINTLAHVAFGMLIVRRALTLSYDRASAAAVMAAAARVNLDSDVAVRLYEFGVSSGVVPSI